ncbi:MAG: hypothetical protein NZM40_02380 [Sphingomonadaceae bacterium]|uniref:hypothetical protein n=1 Tax=Thermaurantiacus sp. TaxID=2820283 RepID=UPI00298F0E64|nr:hypothetical protein [Thermaurantiacus sp.]MCS6986273.1 hypothetical protein [Sphingomonadaceae bacterium]MDW8415722.1 hypothetical protein [Thermaurantiacus sp.]
MTRPARTLFLDRRPGEVRAAVVEGGRLVEMHLERASDGPRPGARWGARLDRDPWGRPVVRLGASLALLDARPDGVPDGALLEVEVVRQAIPEPGRQRPARARVVGRSAEREGELKTAPTLEARLGPAEGPFPADVAAAWAEEWALAETGRVAIAGGELRFSPTPAFLAVDVDGWPDPVAAAQAIARRLRLWGVGGGIAVDFPTRPGRAWRLAAARAFDAAMAGLAFERTGINGFGLLQVVRPRRYPSILDRALLERTWTAALGLLDQALREPRPGRLALVARPEVAACLKAASTLLTQVARQAGRPVEVVADPLAGEGHVEVRMA